jgi:hypothetical protein
LKITSHRIFLGPIPGLLIKPCFVISVVLPNFHIVTGARAGINHYTSHF